MDELTCFNGHVMSECQEIAPGLLRCACSVCRKLYRATFDGIDWKLEEVKPPADNEQWTTDFPVVGDA